MESHLKRRLFADLKCQILPKIDFARRIDFGHGGLVSDHADNTGVQSYQDNHE